MITYETLKSFCAVDNFLRPALNYACRREDGWWASDGWRIICVPMEETQQADLRFHCDELPKSVGRYPNVESVVDIKSFEPTYYIEAKAIEDAIAKLPLIDEYKEVEEDLTFITCPECDGSGEIELDDTIRFNGNRYEVCATTECPICHGHGKIPDIEDYDPDEDDYDPDDDDKYNTMVATGRQIPDTNGTCLHLNNVGYIRTKAAYDILRVAREQQVSVIECQESDYSDCCLFRMHGVIVGIMPLYVDDKLKSSSIDVEINKV